MSSNDRLENQSQGDAVGGVEHTGFALTRYLLANQVNWFDANYNAPYMALSSNTIGESALPDGFRIFEILPSDAEGGRMFNETAARSMDVPYYTTDCPSGCSGEGSIRFFLGMLVAAKADALKPVTTLALIDYQDTHRIAKLEDVTTVAGYRKRGLAAAALRQVLHAYCRSFDVVFLAPTTKAVDFYRRLGFLSLD